MSQSYMGSISCESCPRSCCEDFKLTEEVTHPENIPQILKQYPFIKKTSIDIVFDKFGKEKVVGVYNCDRFDIKTRTCRNYATDPRPDFCIVSGTKFFPHNKCQLMATLNKTVNQ